MVTPSLFTSRRLVCTRNQLENDMKRKDYMKQQGYRGTGCIHPLKNPPDEPTVSDAPSLDAFGEIDFGIVIKARRMS